MTMRNFGLILFVGGILGFFYCTSQMSSLQPLSSDASLGDYLRNQVGRLELARYLAAGAAVVGAILAMFPRGR
jgi:uncharacterized membrane protein (UPF0136 family)